ncbi:MAG TPA: SOS response-associated peptidase [Mycobacteriales bacterium]|nr:SOS response-associated peptidase [Mycobacteriales bacterium]
MCGRYAIGRSPEDLAAWFDAVDETGADVSGDDVGADFNVAPGKHVMAVVSRPNGAAARRRELRVLRWGLVPSWAADPAGLGTRLVNARAETVAEKPAFRAALAARRCLVPADGWYEWAGGVPHYVTPRDGSVLALAAVYEVWARDSSGGSVSAGPTSGNGVPARLVTCAIVTTAAVGELAAIHHRMPLVLSRVAWPDWLDPAADVRTLLAPPAPAVVAGLLVHPVGPAVGNVANNGPALTHPVDPPPTLF